MIPTYDEERIREDDRALVVIPNQYMLRQVLWYHTKYPEGIWEAIVVPYGRKELGKKGQESLYHECRKSGIFFRVVKNDSLRVGDSCLRQVGQFFGYFIQCLTHKRSEYDFRLIKSIMGHCDYKKVIVHPSNMMSTAAVNAVREARHDAIVICMEDGLAEYSPLSGKLPFRDLKELFLFSLSKMKVVNINPIGRHYEMEYDNVAIKYNSLPERMQYRNYKTIKQLFEGSSVSKQLVKERGSASYGDKYDLIVFSAPLREDFKYKKTGGNIYSQLHDFLKAHYADKKILIKPHPREQYGFPWGDLDAEVGETNLAGEEVLDKYPNAEIIFTFASTMLIKMSREKRPYKVICFRAIKDKTYRTALKQYSDLIGMDGRDWVCL